MARKTVNPQELDSGDVWTAPALLPAHLSLSGEHSHRPIHLSLHPPIFGPTHSFRCSCIYPSFLPTYPFCPFMHPGTHSSTHPPTHPLTHPSTHPFPLISKTDTGLENWEVPALESTHLVSSRVRTRSKYRAQLLNLKTVSTITMLLFMRMAA